jgi:hypothetical protein
VSEASRQRWNHEQIPEMGSLDRPSLGFPQPVCRVRRHRRSPVLDNRNPHWGGGSILQENIRPFGNCHAISLGCSRLPCHTSVDANTQKFFNVNILCVG